MNEEWTYDYLEILMKVIIDEDREFLDALANRLEKKHGEYLCK